MMRRTRTIILILILIFTFTTNGYIALKISKVYSIDLSVIIHLLTCKELGCPGGERICIEYFPSPGTTALCFEQPPIQ